MGQLPREAHALVYVKDLDELKLEEGDDRHLRRSLRLGPAEPVIAADGKGRWRLCRLHPTEPGFLEQSGPLEIDPPGFPEITVAFPPLKGERTELAVRGLTELGVDRIVLIDTERSVVTWDPARAAQRLLRLERVAKEAGMQSRRARLPLIEGVLEVSAWLLQGAGRHRAVAHMGGGPPDLNTCEVAVGPEGGWDRSELDIAHVRVGLGPRVLRAETAALTVGAALCLLREGVVRSAATERFR